MTIREELIKTIRSASWPDGGYDGFPTEKIATMIADKIIESGVVPTLEQWGLRYKNLQDEWVYSTPAGVEDAEASARKAKAPGDVLLRRYVTEWEVIDS